MALNGIGGNTVHQVKCNLTLLEIRQWAEYRHRRGTLNIGRRIEQSAANMMSFNYNGKVSKENWIDPIELMPNEDDIIETFEDQMLDGSE